MDKEFESAFCQLNDAVTESYELLQRTHRLLWELEDTLRKLRAAQQIAGEAYLLAKKNRKPKKSAASD